MKRVLMIIPSVDYRDEELLKPKEIFEADNIDVKIASTTMDKIYGLMGGNVSPDILLSDVKINDYDCIIFVGGRGAFEYFDDTDVHKICQEVISCNKILAAICVAPGILAKAGILNGKEVTCFGAVSALVRSNGAEYVGGDVVEDGNIVTANGPQSSGAFAEIIKNKLLNE